MSGFLVSVVLFTTMGVGEQLVSPGAWLTDMCQERYEVREKRSSKKVLYLFSIIFFDWIFAFDSDFFFFFSQLL